jgi:blue light- and temperature-responsive anti-repressor
MSDLYRLVYTSKNQMPGSEAGMAEAVAQILKTARRNNVRADVTGALMFNGGAFAQVLEGPRRGVEQIFERIQRDMRHGDVTILQCGPVESRGFTNWSMAFVGQSARGLAMWSGLAAESGFDLSRIDGDAVFTMLHGLVLDAMGGRWRDGTIVVGSNADGASHATAARRFESVSHAPAAR